MGAGIVAGGAAQPVVAAGEVNPGAGRGNAGAGAACVAARQASGFDAAHQRGEAAVKAVDVGAERADEGDVAAADQHFMGEKGDQADHDAGKARAQKRGRGADRVRDARGDHEFSHIVGKKAVQQGRRRFFEKGAAKDFCRLGGGGYTMPQAVRSLDAIRLAGSARAFGKCVGIGIWFPAIAALSPRLA